MSDQNFFILMGIGGLFVILGIAAIFWGKREEKSYYDALSTRPDTREFLEHEPEEFASGALKIGGWIAIAIGLLMVVMGAAFWFWG